MALATKKKAIEHAKKVGIKISQIVQSPNTKKWYVAPAGVKSEKGKKAYAEIRDKTENKGLAAAMSHIIDKKQARKKK